MILLTCHSGTISYLLLHCLLLPKDSRGPIFSFISYLMCYVTAAEKKKKKTGSAITRSICNPVLVYFLLVHIFTAFVFRVSEGAAVANSMKSVTTLERCLSFGFDYLQVHLTVLPQSLMRQLFCLVFLSLSPCQGLFPPFTMCGHTYRSRGNQPN